MKTPLNNFPQKMNFILLATWFAVVAILGFMPTTAGAAPATVSGGVQADSRQAKAKGGPPKLTIKSPANKTIFTNADQSVTGMVKGKSTIAVVYYELNGTGWTNASTATGWSNWYANVTLDPGANTVQAYAVDTMGTASKIDKISLTFRPVPDSVSGMTMMVSSNGVDNFAMSFTNTTFSQQAVNANFVDGVGTFSFARVNNTTGKLTVRYTAPPNAVSGEQTVNLQFKDATSGLLTNNDGSTSAFVLSLATNLAPVSLGGATLPLISTNNSQQRILTFTAQPSILNNGNLYNVDNPLVISVSAAFVGNIGDRVNVLFSRIKTSSIVTNAFAGTVIAATTGAATNTVTVLFDSSAFVTGQKLYAPAAGSLLNVVTYYYTNYISGVADSTGTGTYTYTNYSPVGALLTLAETNLNSVYVLTFVTNGNSGTYYAELTPSGGPSGSDAGVFGQVAPPQIVTQPQDTTVTNGDAATFTVTTSGSTPLNYQWLGGNIILPEAGSYSGTATPTLTVSPVNNINTPLNYQVIVTNSFGSVTSSVANLTIITP